MEHQRSRRENKVEEILEKIMSENIPKLIIDRKILNLEDRSHTFREEINNGREPVDWRILKETQIMITTVGRTSAGE